MASLIVDTNFAILLLALALVVFGILNLLEAQKDTPNVQNQKSFAIVMLVLSGVIALVFFQSWMPPTEALEADLLQPVEVLQPVEIRTELIPAKPRMSWNDALQVYWSQTGTQVWPKKGSREQTEILEIMG